MSKNDFLLQFLFIVITAAIVSLLVAKFYPGFLFQEKEVHAEDAKREVKHVLNLKKQIQKAPVIPPDFLTIDAIDLKLPISPGVIVDNAWSLYDDKVSWLATSAVVGHGNVILYAHNRVHLFAGLKKLTIGDEIDIHQDGKDFIYVVSELRKIKPTDVEEILSDQDQLTLYTCDGAFDQKRLVVIASLKK